MKRIITTLLCIGALKLVVGEEIAPIVQLASGKVKGLVQQVDGHKIHFFQGIRYGQAKRFEKPTFAPSWTGVYDATKWRDACPQAGIGQPPPGVPAFQTTTMSEDCLFLNVWSPVSAAKNRSVMVFIHGGGFTVGTIFTGYMDGKYLANKGDVVVVSLNYRLGAFGYLYGGTEKTPGNLGFHDQILALKWVKENIHTFGGDPSKVTLFGESAGSWSVSSLILSPLGKGLFNRAIMQSGGANSITGGIPKTRSLVNTKSLAEHLHCPVNTKQATMECLQAKQLMAIVNYTIMDFQSTDRFFTPIYGDEVAPIAPIEALKLGKFNKNIDLMYGVTRDEGTMFALNMFPNYGSNTTNLTIDQVKKDIIHVAEIYKQTFGVEVAEYYTKDLKNPTQDQLKLATSASFGDCHIVCPTILFGEQLVHFSPNSSYYSYRLMQHLGFAGLPYHPWMGVPHADDILFLFAIPFQHKPEDKQLSSDMLTAWTNFAKTGNPGKSGWTEALSKSIPTPKTSYFSLNAADYKMVNGYYTSLCDGFWKSRIVQ